MVFGFLDRNNFGQERYESRIYYQKNLSKVDEFNGFEENFDIFDEQFEPTIIDSNGNQHPDLIFANNDTGNSTLTLYINQFYLKNSNEHRNLNFLKRNLNIGNNYSIPNPNSNAFVDLNGDCRPDLVLTRSDPNIPSKTYIEIYLFSYRTNLLSENLIPNKTFVVDAITGFITFSDFDNDGNIDMLIPRISETTGETSLHIFFNKQTEKESSNLCGASQDLFPGLNLNLFSNENIQNNELHVVHGLITDSKSKILNSTNIRIRVGDINRDGFPDLIVPLKDNKFSLWILEDKSQKYRLSDGNFEEYFNADSSPNYNHIVFFDIGDNGALDFIALIKHTTGEIFTRFYKNEYEYDKLFIKTLGLNGLSSRTYPKGYGVNQVGFTTKFRTQDGVSNKQTYVLAQLTQNSYKALQTPYSITGIGKSYNYIVVFFMGFHVFASDQENENNHFRFYESSVIPNSQLILFPFEPTTPYD